MHICWPKLFFCFLSGQRKKEEVAHSAYPSTLSSGQNDKTLVGNKLSFIALETFKLLQVKMVPCVFDNLCSGVIPNERSNSRHRVSSTDCSATDSGLCPSLLRRGLWCIRSLTEEQDSNMHCTNW